jgi:hypothetical protein
MKLLMSGRQLIQFWNQVTLDHVMMELLFAWALEMFRSLPFVPQVPPYLEMYLGPRLQSVVLQDGHAQTARFANWILLLKILIGGIFGKLA